MNLRETAGQRAADSKPMHLSVVSSIYRSESTIAEFVRQADAAAAAVTSDYEIILVNDGSPDRAREIVIELQSTYPRVTLIDLSRNFGQLPAIHAGLSYSRGDYVFVLDSDLEESPALLRSFMDRLLARPGLDVVYGVQQARRDPPLRALTSRLFYAVFSRMTGIVDLQNMLVLRLMTRRFLDAYLSLGDYHLFIAGLSHHAGFEKETIIVEKSYKGSSGYSFRKRLMMAGDAILSFSTQPLYWLFFGSLAAALLFVLLAGGLVIKRLMNPDFQAGWASLVISTWFVGAVTTNCMAVIGLYVAKVFEQVKDRPRFVVRQVYSSETSR